MDFKAVKSSEKKDVVGDGPHARWKSSAVFISPIASKLSINQIPICWYGTRKAYVSFKRPLITSYQMRFGFCTPRPSPCTSCAPAQFFWMWDAVRRRRPKAEQANTYLQQVSHDDTCHEIFFYEVLPDLVGLKMLLSVFSVNNMMSALCVAIAPPAPWISASPVASEIPISVHRMDFGTCLYIAHLSIWGQHLCI